MKNKNKVPPRILAEIDGFIFKYLSEETQRAYERQSEEMFWVNNKEYIERRNYVK